MGTTVIALLLCTAGDLPGRLIAAAEHDAVVHVALDCSDGWAIAEQPAGLWGAPIEQYAGARRWPLPVSDVQAQAIVSWLRQRVGSGYGYVAVIVDGVRLLAHVAMPQPDTGRYDCSGVLAMAVQQAGWYPFGTQDPRSVTPADWDRIST